MVSTGEYFFRREASAFHARGGYTPGQSTIGEWNPKTRFGSN